jgi:hypothetical protein
MNRVIARLPGSVTELCLVRFGWQARGVAARFYAAKLARAVDRAAAEAVASGAGLLHSERLAFGRGHAGVLQYWRSFDALEDWSHRPPHADWWRGAVERMRGRDDFGVYHEAYLVPRDRVEAIYLNCRPTGLAAFAAAGAPVGADTNSRGRLGLARDQV